MRFKGMLETWAKILLCEVFYDEMSDCLKLPILDNISWLNSFFGIEPGHKTYL